MFTEKDIKQIQNLGLNTKEVQNQIQNFIQGFPYLNIIKPATIHDGMLKLKDEEVSSFIKLYDDLKPDSLKFVPASGAATRMFKFLFEFYEVAKDQYENLDQVLDLDVRKFLANIRSFAFYYELKSIIQSNQLDIEVLLAQGKYKEVLKFFLFNVGLNYGEMPKGVLLFHSYADIFRTAFEEHLIEGLSYSKSTDQLVKIHFTISLEHQELFDALVKSVQADLENQFKVKFDISFSTQKTSTDIVAVDLQNELFRNQDGSLLFRPGGHGALIENLNDLDADVVFIKNIDNVVPDRLKQSTVRYKKALAGLLLSCQEQVFNYLNLIVSKEYTEDILLEIEQFVNLELCYLFEKKKHADLDSRADFLYQILNRPIRVCGMVKNEGEPGGGPFWVKHSNGTIDLQIVETSQINAKDKSQQEILKSSTHFNPVDLVCSIKNYKSQKFDLLKFRDPNTGFISVKSKDGKDLKAQELPGLWNGAMANWNTIFIEVPIDTFNPVKTVNDLLRSEHQNK